MSLTYLYSRMLKKSRLSAIRSSVIDSTSKIEAGCTVIGSVFARHSFCGYDCSILNCDVGSFCSIASRVSIGGVAHPIGFVSTSPVFLSHKDSVRAKFSRHNFLPEVRTRIGNDVWIGEGAFIKAGVQIGHGAVVGMGAVVTKNVEPYAIVGGNPATLLRMRFRDEVIKGLLKLKWWEMSDTDLRRVAAHFDSPDELLRREGLL
jgi:chloramphenicol O-acetyltransferase type B